MIDVICIVLAVVFVLFPLVTAIFAHYFMDWPVHVLEEQKEELENALSQSDETKRQELEEGIAGIQKSLDEIEEFRREQNKELARDYEYRQEHPPTRYRHFP